MQARHEYKHNLNYADYIIIRDRLKYTMQSDNNADENGEYKVRSLYFDTPGDKALREKIDGVDNREKFRIRRYIGENGLFVLEKKSKRHGLCYKSSCRLTYDETQLLQNSNVKWMALDERNLVQELYSKIKFEQLSPKTIVEYIREPFVCLAGNVRVTFDRPMIAWIFKNDEYLKQYHDVFVEYMDYFNSGEFVAMYNNAIELISLYVEKDPTAFCTYEDFLKGSAALRKLCLLRAESIKGQLDGTIAATSEEQVESENMGFINASSIDMNSMGSNSMEFNREVGEFPNRQVLYHLTKRLQYQMKKIVYFQI